MPVLVREDVPMTLALPIGERLDQCDGFAHDAILDHLPLTVQILELRRELLRTGSRRRSGSARGRCPGDRAALPR